GLGHLWQLAAEDHETGRPVVILRGELPEMAEALLLEEEAPPVEAAADDDLMPAFDTPATAVPVAQAQATPAAAPWPSVGWELALLEKASHPALPGVIETFADGSNEYLIEEVPQGSLL